jgi:hypothetical protein
MSIGDDVESKLCLSIRRLFALYGNSTGRRALTVEHGNLYLRIGWKLGNCKGFPRNAVDLHHGSFGQSESDRLTAD